jgi:alkylated DNA repair dioxygenase AlkB
LGWHTDNDPGINHERPIAVVSFGSRRDIMVRPIVSRDPIISASRVMETATRGFDNDLPETVERINLTNGSLFLMDAGMQQTHQHRIPKAGEKRGPRVSLTFRSLI